MGRHGIILVIAVAFLAGLAGTGQAVTVPLTDPTYIPHDDVLAWNWHVLELSGTLAAIPHSPSGNTVWLRMFTGGNTNATPNAAPVFTPVKLGNTDLNPTQSARYWFGLHYDKQDDVVDNVLTAGQVLGVIQGLDGPAAVCPVFLFDQNQHAGAFSNPIPAGWPTDPTAPNYPQDRDIWLRSRLILVPPSAIPGGLGALNGLPATQVNALIDPLVQPAVPGIPNPPGPYDYMPSVDPVSGVVTFYFRDTVFNDFPDAAGNASHPTWTNNWSYLPGLYDPTAFLTLPPDYFPPGTDTTVNNNGSGAFADWGGYFPRLDLSLYSDYAFFFELQSLYNNNGFEEMYIVGGLPLQQPPIPEPVTMAGLLLGIGSVVGYARKRWTA